MAQYVKAKKVKQKSKSLGIGRKIWNGVKTILLSLFNNQACVDAKDKKWYWAVPLGLVSTVLAVVPLGVMQWQQTGSVVLNSPTYSIENGLIAFQESLEDNHLSVKVNGETHMLEVDESAWNTAYAASDKAFSYIYTKTVTKMKTETVTSGDSTSTTVTGPAENTTVSCCDLTVYYYADSANFETLINTTLSGKDVLGNETYSVNALFLGKDKFALYKHPSGAKSAQARITGYYDGPTFDFANFTKQDSHGKAYDVSRAQVTNGNKLTYIENSTTAWKTFLNDAWDSQRIVNGWRASGIWLGVYAGLTVIMGFLVWLMTRGKNNPFRVFNLWQTQKIAYWSALCPAILSLILGFIMPQFIQMYFIFLFGFRIMWMSMKTLRPYQQ